MLFGPFGLAALHREGAEHSERLWPQPLQLPSAFLDYSAELRNLALVIILIRAGLGLKKDDLIQVGAPALKLSFIPALLEASVVAVCATFFLNLSPLASALLAFVVAAVSPAVIVPKMLDLLDHVKLHRTKGSAQRLPTMILAAASLDDVFAIAVFGVLLQAAVSSTGIEISAIWSFPLYLLSGMAIGVLLGKTLGWVFKRLKLTTVESGLCLLFVCLLFKELEQTLPFKVCSLLGIMTLCFMIAETSKGVALELSALFKDVWVGAELILFLLVGAGVNLMVLANLSWTGILILSLGLLSRSFGVWLSLRKTAFYPKEKLYCAIAFIPKATVQAAIGGLVLEATLRGETALPGGTATGEIILARAVLAILLTAPLGAIGMDLGRKKLLH
jgi:NhaP-type Na+/H+ or K+/H+ antiporter